LHAERCRCDRDEEQGDERLQQEERLRQEAAARSEIDDILDGPPPELPGGCEPVPTDFTLQLFDQAIETLLRLHTKPLSFVATTHDLGVINTVYEFMAEVAGHIKKQRATTRLGRLAHA
jgi:hypothetical protein